MNLLIIALHQVVHKWLGVTYHLRTDQRVDIEGQKETIEEVICQDVVQEFTVDDEDVVQVVEMIEVLCYQVTQLPSVLMPETQQRQTRLKDTFRHGHIYIYYEHKQSLVFLKVMCIVYCFQISILD